MSPKEKVRANIYKALLEEEKRKNKRMSIFSVGLFFVGVVTMSTYNSFVNTVPSPEINSASVITAEDREALVTTLLKINNHPEKLRDWPDDVSATYFNVWC